MGRIQNAIDELPGSKCTFTYRDLEINSFPGKRFLRLSYLIANGAGYTLFDEAETFTATSQNPEDEVAQYVRKYGVFVFVSESDWPGVIQQAIEAASLEENERLGLENLERYGDCEGVTLPSDLSDDQKKKFLSEFASKRGKRCGLADIIRCGSIYCDNYPCPDRSIHFQGTKCSLLGCAVLGITCGEIPCNTNPEILFWAVHAAAGLLMYDKQQAIWINRPYRSSSPSGMHPGSRTRSSVEGYWGKGQIFDRLLNKQSFSQLRHHLMKENFRDSKLVHSATYKSSYEESISM